MPLAVARVIEQVQDQLRPTIAGHVGQRMRPDLRPFHALLDVRLDIASPLDPQTLRFRECAIIVQNVDMALKVADGNQLILPITIHVGHPEPAVGATGMVAQFGLLVAGRAVEDHHPIVRRHADFLDPVAVQIANDIQGVEHGPLGRVGFPDQARLIEAAVVGEQLKLAHSLIGPGVIPADALVSGHVGQDLAPALVKRLHRGAQRATTIEVEPERPRGRNRCRTGIRPGRGVQCQVMRARSGLECDEQLTPGQREGPRNMRSRDELRGLVSDRSAPRHSHSAASPGPRPVVLRPARRCTATSGNSWNRLLASGVENPA